MKLLDFGNNFESGKNSMKILVPQKFFQVGKMVEKLHIEENFLIRKNNLKIDVREDFLGVFGRAIMK